MRLTLLPLLLVAGAASAQRDPGEERAAFVIRLGNDTTVIERVSRSRTQVVAEAVQRAPTTSVHRMVMDLTPGGAVSRSVYSVSRPGSAEPNFTWTATFDGDSATLVSGQGAAERRVRVAARDAIPIAGPFYTPYEMAMMRAVARGRARDSVRLLPGAGTVSIPVERVAPDSLALTNQFAEAMRARVDERGRLLGLRTPALATVERVAWLDLDPWIREFAARDSLGRSLGQLSPRAASRVAVSGANLWLDYGRPAMRGRPVWGTLVPYGQVWRVGANDAAHFSTDRALQLGDLALEPGTYTLFLLPTADRWTLVVNRRTGMSGLEYDPAGDVGRIEMVRQALERPAERFTLEVRPAEGGANLYLAWDRAAATVPIRLRP